MTISPQSSEEDVSPGEIVRDVLQNWRAELRLAAGEFRDRLRLRGATPTAIAFDEHDVIVFAGNGEIGRIPLVPDQDLLAGKLALLCAAPADVSVQLSASDVLRPVVRLPRASTRTLRSALSFELGRLSPLNPADLYFDFRTLPPEQPKQAAEIALRIVRRAVADRAVALCHGAGLQVAAMMFENDPQQADWRVFPLDRAALLRAWWRRWSVGLLCGLAALLLIAVVFAALDRVATSMEVLDGQVSEEQSRALRVEHMEHDIRAIAAQSEFLNRQKGAPLFVAVLAEISRVLPNNTWLSEIEQSGNKIRIRGSSGAPSDLIALVDASPHFANAQFAAPLVQDAPGRASHFDLAFEVRP